MATDEVRHQINVSPVDNEDGTLKGLNLQPQSRNVRKSSDGRQLRRDWWEDDGEPLFVPIGALADLVREMVDWPTYYANGQAARDSKDGWVIPGTESAK
jgi:hypothetical protein